MNEVTCTAAVKIEEGTPVVVVDKGLAYPIKASEERFNKWLNSEEPYFPPHTLHYKLSLAAWNEATRIERERCAKKCGNQYDFLKEAILRGGK